MFSGQLLYEKKPKMFHDITQNIRINTHLKVNY